MKKSLEAIRGDISLSKWKVSFMRVTEEDGNRIPYKHVKYRRTICEKRLTLLPISNGELHLCRVLLFFARIVDIPAHYTSSFKLVSHSLPIILEKMISKVSLIYIKEQCRLYNYYLNQPSFPETWRIKKFIMVVPIWPSKFPQITIAFILSLLLEIF